MSSFDANLGAYHALNAKLEAESKLTMAKIASASTQEEADRLRQEYLTYMEAQGKTYEKLGTEMVNIMSKKWWQFWK